jgi:hypothetical protein
MWKARRSGRRRHRFGATSRMPMCAAWCGPWAVVDVHRETVPQGREIRTQRIRIARARIGRGRVTGGSAVRAPLAPGRDEQARPERRSQHRVPEPRKRARVSLGKHDEENAKQRSPTDAKAHYAVRIQRTARRAGQQGSQEARLQLCRLDHRLRPHAGRGHGQRPRRSMFSARFRREACKAPLNAFVNVFLVTRIGSEPRRAKASAPGRGEALGENA